MEYEDVEPTALNFSQFLAGLDPATGGVTVVVTLLVVTIAYRVGKWDGSKEFRNYQRLVQNYVPPTDDYCLLPEAFHHYVRDRSGEVKVITYAKGVAVAWHKPSNLTMAAETRRENRRPEPVPEMAVQGSPMPIPTRKTNARFAVFFLSEDSHVVGCGFRIYIESRQQDYIVTATHVLQRARGYRGGTSRDVWPLPVEGILSESDISFVPIESPSLLGVKKRPYPAQARSGPVRMDLFRDDVLEALGRIEGRWNSRHAEWHFGLVHSCCTLPGDSGSCILSRQGKPVAVHVGADPHTGKNVGVALAPVIRILFSEKTIDPVDETIPDSSDYLYEERTFDDFVAVPRRKKVSKKNYAIADNGQYTVAFVPDSYWADYQDDEFDPDELYIPPVPETTSKRSSDFWSTPPPREVPGLKSWAATTPNGFRFRAMHQEDSSLLEPFRISARAMVKPNGEQFLPKSSNDSQKLEPLVIRLDRLAASFEKLSDTLCAEPQPSAHERLDLPEQRSTSVDGNSNGNSRRRRKKSSGN